LPACPFCACACLLSHHATWAVAPLCAAHGAVLCCPVWIMSSLSLSMSTVFCLARPLRTVHLVGCLRIQDLFLRRLECYSKWYHKWCTCKVSRLSATSVCMCVCVRHCRVSVRVCIVCVGGCVLSRAALSVLGVDKGCACWPCPTWTSAHWCM
jgi:hypothetical protein